MTGDQGDSAQFPKGWVWAKLEQCVDILDGKRVPVNADTRNERQGGTPYYGATGQVGWIDDYLFDEELVLLGEDGAPFGDPFKSKAYIVRGRSWVNNHAHVLRAVQEITTNSFLCFYLNLFNYDGYVSGTTRLKLSQAPMRKIPVPLPPLPEQHRIVAKIEELFTRLDAGVEALNKIKRQLKRYRQSVLKAAFEGKLTAEWREAHKGELEPASALLERIREDRKKKLGSKYKELPPVDTAGLPELPEGWAWTSVGQIGDVTGGLTKNSKRNRLSLKLPYLRVANVYAGRLDLDDVEDLGVERSELDRVLLQKGDLLVVEGNGSRGQIGRVALWGGSVSPCVHQNHIIKVRFCPPEVAKYVLYWLLSSEAREHITTAASTTSGLYTLSLSKVSALLVPFAQRAEQDRIVEEIERCLTIADQLEKTVEHGLKQTERLRQSILKRAFEGKLVPQDPNDEPAEKLLERIQAERAKQPQANRGAHGVRKQPTVARVN